MIVFALRAYNRRFFIGIVMTMNPNWKNFLLSTEALFETETQIAFPAVAHDDNKRIYPLAHLSVLTVGGKDAATLLQGQITCNINDITEEKSSLAALCNPKGRVIATFLLIKKAEVFLLVLPLELLEAVKKRLSLYVLRSLVTISDSSDEYCLIGLCRPDIAADALFAATCHEETIFVNLGKRYLLIAEPDKAIAVWQEYVNQQGFQPGSSAQWCLLDIISGIPWLTTETSEEFIPQMLNLDKLGGISFNKGCYTGQEIVARTHYLGQAKRAMFLAECTRSVAPAPNAVIIDDRRLTEAQADAEQAVVGRVLMARQQGAVCKMLIVLPLADNDHYRLKLADQSQLTILPFAMHQTVAV